MEASDSTVLNSLPSAPHPVDNRVGVLIPNRIFVGGLDGEVREADLTRIFSIYGSVKSARIIYDNIGNCKGYGFVTFETVEECRRLQNAFEYIVVGDRKLSIAPAIKKQPPVTAITGFTVYTPNQMPYWAYVPSRMPGPLTYLPPYNMPGVYPAPLLYSRIVPGNNGTAGVEQNLDITEKIESQANPQ
ncbi:protein boule-like [Teleopsis dalmanni]|uniref:protein boule-like n=1 Tax=Teleopsis dalmanni TaxID=139649 RepID=UPI0018CF084C|nr:protein boule-like [Teleopsis dalmanni]XP_037959717.1 protein boule-like [Teleopsis dalmanni]